MFLCSRRVVLLALLAATALLAPAAAVTTGSKITDSAADQETASDTSDMKMDMEDEEDTDEPVDSGLECSNDFAADGQCDNVNNSAACGYDGGDCCLCTCVPTIDFNCGGNYNCIDPDAECVNDDDGDGGVMTTLTIEADDMTEDMEGAEETDTNTNDTDSATGTRPSSFISAAGLAAAAGSAVLLAGWGL